MSAAPDGPEIAVVIGSTRPARICPGIAAWTRGALAEGSPLAYRLLDLADVDLPMLDEPLKAALHEYRHPHTIAWSKLVSGYAGFVFVLPQYNWGYPAVLKNALDFLYHEWRDKPVTSVTYGTRGGNKGADQIHQVFEGLHMRSLEERTELKITDDDVDEQWQLRDLDEFMEPYRPSLRAIDEQMAAALEFNEITREAAPS